MQATIQKYSILILMITTAPCWICAEKQVPTHASPPIPKPPAGKKVARNAEVKMRAANSLLEEKRFKEAAIRYEEILKQFPLFEEASFDLGICYLQLGRLSEGELALKNYLKSRPESADGHAVLGMLLVQAGRMREAMFELEKASKLDPSQSEVRKTLSRLYLQAGNIPAAIRELEQVIQAESRTEPEVYLRLTRCYLSVKNEPRAIEICNQGLRIHSYSLEYQIDLAQLLLEFNPLGKETEGRIKQLVAGFPLAARAHYLRAQWAYARKDLALCAEELNRSLTLNPDDVTCIRILTLLAVTAEDSGAAEKANLYFQDAYSLNRKLSFPDTHSAMTFVDSLERRQQEAEAQNIVGEILSHYPGLGAAHFSRARYFLRKRQPEKAIQEAQLALKDTGDNLALLQSLHAFLAKTYFSTGNHNGAQKHQTWVETHTNK